MAERVTARMAAFIPGASPPEVGPQAAGLYRDWSETDRVEDLMDREKDALTEIAQRHEFEIISLGSNRRHMDLPEYRAAIQGAEAVQEQTAAATQELTDLQEQKTELKREIKSLSGASAALKAAERVRVDFDTIRPEKTLTGAVKGVTVEQIRDLKAAAMC